MCGIAGIVGSPPRDPGLIERMTATLRHRGPDDQGVWTSPEAHLGHTRLAILDLTQAAHQPMEHAGCALTYNGEIYNFRELRRGLEGPWRSDSDAEVLLHLLARDGAACLPRLRGMFAFACWDRRRRRLIATRDRLGIKPLYYRQLEGGLAFASEAKALLEIGRPPADLSAIRDVVTYGYVPAPKSAWQGIRKLPPAHVLTWEDGRLSLERYWDPEPRIEIRDSREACERLEALLEEIIPLHTLSDVPVGVLLSGGIDSAVVTAFLDQPRTFTLGQDVGRRSETPAARRVAEHLGTVHCEEIAGAVDLERAVETMPGLYDEPYGDSAAWSVWLVSQLARRDVKVVLSGEGGDEVFCGYSWYSCFFGSTSGPLGRALLGVVPAFIGPGRSLHRKTARGIERYGSFPTVFTTEQRNKLLGPRLANVHDDDLWHIRAWWREDLDPIRRMQWVDLHTYLPDGMLTKVDRASRAHSLEVRPPLLDYRLVEFSLRLDPKLQRDIEGNQGKLLLRRLMRDRLPPGHFDLPKRGFNLPIRRWASCCPELVDGALDRLAGAGLIRRPRLARFKNEQVWALLVLDRWVTASGAF